MATVEAYLMKKTVALKTLLTTNKVKMQFLVKKVTMGLDPFKDDDFKALIGTINPVVIDWSNVPDYFV